MKVIAAVCCGHVEGRDAVVPVRTAELVGGRLRIVEEVGRGAFSRVYLAINERTGAEVALKTMRLPRDGDAFARLAREIRILEGLGSPSIVRLRGCVCPPRGGLALELEYVDGHTLEEWLALHGALSQEAAALVWAGMVDAVAHAHERGVLHRDIKPANVLLTRDGRAKLTDFGLGRQKRDPRLEASRLGALVGTPCYMAPEVVRGDLASPASDVWSLGVVLHTLLTGDQPFHGDSLDALSRNIGKSKAPSLNGQFVPYFEGILQRCLRKRPSERPTARELLATIPSEILEFIATKDSARRASRRGKSASHHVPAPGTGAALRMVAVVAAVCFESVRRLLMR